MAITVVYGSYTISNQIEKIRENLSYRNYSLEIDFLIEGTSPSNLVANCQAAEDALRKDSQRLQVLIGGTVHRDYDPATKTGLLIRTSLVKSGSTIDSEYIRRYTFRAEVQLPADDLAQDSYRQEAQWQLTYSPSRRAELAFSGTYTAGGGNTAKANYDANVDAWIDSVFTALGLTKADFELVSEQVSSRDDENAFISFSRSYREVIFPENSTTNNSPAIVDAQVSFARQFDTTQVGANIKAPVRVTVNYSCNVDKADPTFGSYTALDDLWKGTIKPYLLSQAKSLWGGSITAIENESATIDPVNRTIQSSMTILVEAGGGNLLRYQETIELSIDPQNQYRKLWDGSLDTYVVFSNGRKTTATQTIDIERIGAFPTKPPFIDSSSDVTTGLVQLEPKLRTGLWVLDHTSVRFTPFWNATDPDKKGSNLKRYQVTYTRRYSWVSPSTLGLDGGGRIRTVVPPRVIGQAL